MTPVEVRPAVAGDAAAVAAIWAAGWRDGHLLAEAERLVAAGGHRQAWLNVVPGNARARSFYQRQGWTDEGPVDLRITHAGEVVTVPCHRYLKPL